MAFQAASGWTNLPNGVWSPVIYSKKVQKTFRKKSVVQELTNTDYFGEIANFGDSVKIIKEPEITINSYARGTHVEVQDLEDEDFTLIIDQSNYWAFPVDDIEAAHAHVNWESLASDRAAYKLAQKFDQEVLGHMLGYELVGGVWTARTTASGTASRSDADSDELLAIHKLARDDFVTAGSASDSLAIGTAGTYDITPLTLLNRMARLLDEQNVPEENRWFVGDPVFFEKLMDEDSKLMDRDWGVNGDGDVLRNGRVGNMKLRGFTLYKSNNLPYLGTGPGTVDTNGSNANWGVVAAGHKGAVATAQQLAKTEKYRSHSSFGDVVRGMHLYGRKILRPESIVRAIYNVNA